jgi:hypothetical protein
MLQKDMDKTVRTFGSFAEMKAEEYRYWQSRPVHERMAAVSEITRAAWSLKEALPDVPRLQRTVAVLPRPRR